jgi:5,10-methylene-tetrahydrofolate dehydrogenase/methenyl tetrahydrofolate cyclohydrolase
MHNLETPGLGFRSDLLVAETSARLNARVQGWPAEQPLRVAFPLARPDEASISYAYQALDYGDRPGVVPEVWLPGPDGFELVTAKEELRERAKGGLWVPTDDGDTVEFVRSLGDRKDLHGAVPLLPGATLEGDTAIREAMPVHLDHDSISPRNPLSPSTPVGMVRLAEHIARKALAATRGRIAVLGRGKLVGGPLVDQVLPEFNVGMRRVTVFDRRHEVEASYARLAGGEFRWIFSAFPAAAKIMQLARRSILIDAGYAVGEDGHPGGNAHPDVLARSATRATRWARWFGTIATSFRHGAGPVTIAEVYDRAAEARILRTARTHKLAEHVLRAA